MSLASILPELSLTVARAQGYEQAMDLDRAARCLEKLGNPTRLEIFRLLVRAGDGGLAVGELQDRLDIPASTLSHHLTQLVSVGLVHQARQGRVLRCTPDFALMNAVLRYLTEKCCRGV